MTEPVEITTIESLSNPSSPSQYDKCPVCLNTIEDKSILEGCFHEFCFSCIKEWSKVKPVCPLCKQNFSIIMHNIVSDAQYDTYKVFQIATTEEPDLSLRISTNIDGLSRFRYRTTLTSNSVYFTIHRQMRRLRTLGARIDQLNDRHRLRQQEERINPAPGSLGFRKLVYQNNLWAQNAGCEFHQEYDISAAFLAANPACTHRLAPWLNREILALEKIPRRPTTITIADTLAFILQLVTQYDIASIEFCHRLRPTFSVETRHFAHELLYFAKSGMEMENYDICVVYGRPNQAWADTVVSSQSESSSDERMDTSPRIANADTPPRSRLFKVGLKRNAAVPLIRQGLSDSTKILKDKPSRSRILNSKRSSAFSIPFLNSDTDDEEYSLDNIKKQRLELEYSKSNIHRPLGSGSKLIRDSVTTLCENESSSSSTSDSDRIGQFRLGYKQKRCNNNLNNRFSPISSSSESREIHYKNIDSLKLMRDNPLTNLIGDQSASNTDKSKLNSDKKILPNKKLIKPNNPVHIKPNRGKNLAKPRSNNENLRPLLNNVDFKSINSLKSLKDKLNYKLNLLGDEGDIDDEVEIVRTERPWNLRSPISLSSDTDSDNLLSSDNKMSSRIGLKTSLSTMNGEPSINKENNWPGNDFFKYIGNEHYSSIYKKNLPPCSSISRGNTSCTTNSRENIPYSSMSKKKKVPTATLR